MKEGKYVNIKTGREVYFTSQMINYLGSTIKDWLPVDNMEEKVLPKELVGLIKIEYNQGKDNPLFKLSLKEIKESAATLSNESLEVLREDERSTVVAFVEKELKRRNADRK